MIVRVRDFTDPSSPEAFAAERVRLRLLWLYGEQLQWEPCMTVVDETAPYGETPESVAAARRRVAERSGMPIDARPPLRLARGPGEASVPDVLEWAGMPLATAEVAAICGRDVAAVREELRRAARFEPAGADGYWALA